MSNSHLQVVMSNIDSQIESLMREVATLQNARALISDNFANVSKADLRKVQPATSSKGKGRGRPKKSESIAAIVKSVATKTVTSSTGKKGRGRPKGTFKVAKPSIVKVVAATPENRTKGRGRPKGTFKVVKPSIVKVVTATPENGTRGRGRPKGTFKVTNPPAAKQTTISPKVVKVERRGRPKGTFKNTSPNNAYRNRVIVAETPMATQPVAKIIKKNSTKGNSKTSRPVATAASQGRRGRKPKISGAKSSDPGPATKKVNKGADLSVAIEKLKIAGKKMDLKQRVLEILKLDREKISIKDLSDKYLNIFGDNNLDIKIQRLKIVAIIKRITSSEGVSITAGTSSADTFYQLA